MSHVMIFILTINDLLRKKFVTLALILNIEMNAY